MYYLYKTTNLINGKIYIGVHFSLDIENDKYLGSGFALRRSIIKHGKVNFKRELLKVFTEMEEAYMEESLLVCRSFVDRKDTYNLKVGGKGAGGGEDHHMYGRSHTEESKLKISETSKGRVFTEDHRQNMSKSSTGRVMTAESKLKMSLSKKAIYQGEGHPLYGKHHSEETRRKISEANKGPRWSEEDKQQMSLKRKGANNANSKYIWITPKGAYYSAQQAAEDFGVSRKTIEKRCRAGASGDALWVNHGWDLKLKNP